MRRRAVAARKRPGRSAQGAGVEYAYDTALTLFALREGFAMKTWKTCCACHRFVAEGEVTCPFCGAGSPCAKPPSVTRTFPSRAQVLTGAAVMTAGAIAACTAYGQSDYGTAGPGEYIDAGEGDAGGLAEGAGTDLGDSAADATNDAADAEGTEGSGD
jgi:hypothetical protein